MPVSLDALIDQLKTGATASEVYGVVAPSNRSRATVEKVLDEAVEVLATEGVSGLSFRALARRCDMRLSNLQYYFATQDALLTAVTRHASAARLEELRARGALTLPDLRERFHAYLDFCMDRARTPRAQAIASGLKDLAQRLDGPAKHFGAACQFHIHILEEMVAAFSSDLPAQTVTHKAVMIAGLVDTVGPMCGMAYAPPEGLREAILTQASDIAGATAGL
ncbi:TetR/AcrR family transcriptional regulator [Celeribacter sp. PS-C1]|uniref:TetR/AcrR family transcriptional regulator n=1 Tax=Celeribacter sp. PS-C1 TaxID=2820813 RepID=UPI001C682CE6|nr:TetR/AcrR family transcriptional regulator [Celeribacter sp. PS-C1]MBW6418469.1 TetR/AcrR family transcriptional regulator [Celeribacter sp. PS-C1]